MSVPKTSFCACGSGKDARHCCFANIETAFKMALEMLRKGDLPQGFGVCRAIQELEPDNAQARQALASAHLEVAVDAVGKNRYRVAEQCCQIALNLVPGMPEAHHTLGHISWRSGLPTAALGHFRAALRARPDWQPAKDALAMAERDLETLPPALLAAPGPIDDGTQRFLLIKAWGFGFWSDVAHVLGAYLLAEICGRTPVVHWGKNSLFRAAGDTTESAFEQFFEPVSSYGIQDLITLEGGIFPPKWNRDNLYQEDQSKWQGGFARMGPLDLFGRQETVAVSDFYLWASELLPWIEEGHRFFGLSVGEIYRELVKSHLIVRPEIDERAAAFRRDVINAPYIAIHARGLDKEKEVLYLQQLNAAYDELVDQAAKRFPEHKLFLMTDDKQILAHFQQRYGDRLVHTECDRGSGQTGLHYCDGVDGKKLGEEVLIDTLVATGADAFIGNGQSNVSCIVPYLKDWRQGDVTLIGKNMFEDPNRPLETLVM
jgi:tetratricopeptide (TPR) repeat protein